MATPAEELLALFDEPTRTKIKTRGKSKAKAKSKPQALFWEDDFVLICGSLDGLAEHLFANGIASSHLEAASMIQAIQTMDVSVEYEPVASYTKNSRARRRNH